MSFVKTLMSILGITSLAVTYAMVVVFLLAISPLCILLLWNWLMPHIFGLPMINFWEALGINLLAMFLFK